MCQYVIELTGLTKKYGDFTAVNDLNLQIRKGEIFGLLGPNGAGKSTTILMMLGLTEPTTGSVKVCDIDSTTHPIEVKRKVGYLPEDVGFYEDMTGIENLVYTAALNGIRRKEAREKAERLLDRIGKALSPSAWASDYQVIAYQRFMLNLLRFAPSELFNEATMTLLMPSVRSLGPLTMEQVHGAIPSPLPLGQSLLVVWPQLTGLIAATVVCFALSYVSFMRKEVRSR